ncbi:aldo/keto reductase, partial [Acetobacterium wieringae]|uniref:aldo/keto reductase n=1 Tax=Acetobacterium wieringae TaxID=52694 RepID=UPI002B212527
DCFDTYNLTINMVAWRAMEEAVESGKLRAIGASNFEKEDLDNILQNGKIKPVVNQILPIHQKN